jgi:hypothetical protein
MLIVMRKPKRKVLLVLLTALVSGLVLTVGYAYQKWRFVQRANAIFDPQEKAFRGIFLPWPVGRPTLAGGLNPEADRRIRAALGYELGSISTNGMTLIITDSAGTFVVHAN